MNAVGPSALFHLRTKAASTAPLVLTLQQQVLESQKESADTLLGQALGAAHWVVGCSESALSQATHIAHDLVHRSSVIWNGLAPPARSPGPLPFSPPRLLCLGRLVPAKGFDIALDAFAKLSATMPGLHLDIAGDGAERDALIARAERLGLGDRVRFLGWVEPEYVYQHLNQATAVLMPSRREGLPLVALQAGLMGRPVVASRVGGLAEVVRDNLTGRLVDPEDVDGLAAATRGLLEDPDLATRMGRAARERASAVFSWDATVQAYDRLYRRFDPKAELETLTVLENA
jgi:glycogen(starch) synthase